VSTAERAQLERAFIASADRLPTLYSLSETYNRVLDLLEAAEDPEGTPDLELELDRIAGDITHKAENIAGLVAHLEGLAIVRKSEANRLRARAEVCEARAERLRGYLTRNMEAIGQRRIETNRFTLTVRSYPHVEVSDAAQVPSEYQRTRIEVSVDKKAILSTFRKNGELVPGTEIIHESKVQIA
jgi:Siphovirus Gp157